MDCHGGRVFVAHDLKQLQSVWLLFWGLRWDRKYITTENLMGQSGLPCGNREEEREEELRVPVSLPLRHMPPTKALPLHSFISFQMCLPQAGN